MTRQPLKALIVRSPYAQKIADGSKPIEFRSWRTHYRGWLAIVAARRRDSGQDAGRIVCIVRLVDCVQVGHKDFEWKLADPRPLNERVEIPGRLGLFDVTDAVPASVLALMEPGQVAAPAAPYVAPPAKPARNPRTRRVPAGAMEVSVPSHLMY